ncbi:MAG: fructokinase2-like [Bacilli bacterium]|nr:fructokinase2-like [Bacilli bacterium]
MKTNKIIAFGEALIDFVSLESGCGLEDAHGFAKAAGGAPANVAAAVAKLGGKAGFIGKVGKDPFGYFLRNTLQEIGVEVSHLLHSNEAKTTLAFVSLQENGERDFMFYRQPGADMLLNVSDINESYIQSAAIFHFGSISLGSEPIREATLHAIRIAKAANAVISFDPNWRPALWDSPNQALYEFGNVLSFVDIIKLNEEEIEFFTGTTKPQEAAERLHIKGISLVTITLGEKGCYYSYAKEDFKTTGFCPGFSVIPLDTTGAGDSFIGGLLTRLLETSVIHAAEISLGSFNWSVDDFKEAVRFAVVTSALTVTKKGGIPALPHREEVEGILQSEK